MLTYVGLPALLCGECGGSLFARIDCVLSCAVCSPVSSPDEWLDSGTKTGIRRWRASGPPETEPEPQQLMFVAADLTWFLRPLGSTTLDLIHWSGEWAHRLDRRFFAWLNMRLQQISKSLPAEVLAEANGEMHVIADVGHDCGVLGLWSQDEPRWPIQDNNWSPFADAETWDAVIADSESRLCPEAGVEQVIRDVPVGRLGVSVFGL